MPRILVLIPGLFDAATLSRRAEVDRAVLDEDVALVHMPVPASPAILSSAADRAVGEIAILEAGLAAEREGYDAVLIDSMEDCGLAALRSILAIPVVAPGKASLLYALTLGNRFSVIVPAEALGRTHAAVREYGLERHCVSVQAVEWNGHEENVPELLACARAAVEDGAEVVCLGATSIHSAPRLVASSISIPVVDPWPLALKLAESLLALGLTQSRRAYPAPMVRKDELLRSLAAVAAHDRREA